MKKTLAASASAGLLLASISTVFAASQTIVVRPDNMQGWTFFQEDVPVGTGMMVTGPATPPLGTGSAELTVDSTGRENLALYNQYNGKKLSTFTDLSYATYRSDGGVPLQISLQIEVDSDITDANDAYQGRLIFEPYQTDNTAASSEDVWQTWNPMQGKWWNSGSAATRPLAALCPQDNPCTWSQILAAYPNAGTRNSNAGILLRAGGPWTGGFKGNVDAFKIGINGDAVTYNFEPNEVDTDGDGVVDSTDNCPNVASSNMTDTDNDGIGDVCDTSTQPVSKEQCKNGGYVLFTNPSFKNQGQCVSAATKSK